MDFLAQGLPSAHSTGRSSPTIWLCTTRLAKFAVYLHKDLALTAVSSCTAHKLTDFFYTHGGPVQDPLFIWRNIFPAETCLAILLLIQDWQIGFGHSRHKHTRLGEAPPSPTLPPQFCSTQPDWPNLLFTHTKIWLQQWCHLALPIN